MITLLHGDNTSLSRQELTRKIEEAKGSGKEIRRIDGKTVDELALTQALESSSLFGGDVLVVIEGLLVKRSKLTDVLKTAAGDTILWEDKEIGKTVITSLGPAITVQLFRTPVVIWELLDGIRPAAGRAAIERFHRALAQDAAELIFSLLVRRVRQLVMLKDGVTPEGLQSWQAGRLTSQAKSFTMDKLLSMEKKLLATDISIKTGGSPFTLTQHLELFFVDL